MAGIVRQLKSFGMILVLTHSTTFPSGIAQLSSSTITGAVIGQSVAAVSGVAITVKNANTGSDLDTR